VDRAGGPLYVLDLAEIPRHWKRCSDGSLERSSPARELKRKAAEQVGVGQAFEDYVNGPRRGGRSFLGADLTISDGLRADAGERESLRTLRLRSSAGSSNEDGKLSRRAGWKEIVISAETAPGDRRSDPGATRMRSQVLTAYPQVRRRAAT